MRPTADIFRGCQIFRDKRQPFVWTMDVQGAFRSSKSLCGFKIRAVVSRKLECLHNAIQQPVCQHHVILCKLGVIHVTESPLHRKCNL